MDLFQLCMNSSPNFIVKTLHNYVGLTANNDEDSCQAIVGLRFVNGDDCDTILVKLISNQSLT